MASKAPKAVNAKGKSRQQKWQQEQIDAGNCRRCGNPRGESKINCDDCLKDERERKQKSAKAAKKLARLAARAARKTSLASASLSA